MLFNNISNAKFLHNRSFIFKEKITIITIIIMRGEGGMPPSDS